MQRSKDKSKNLEVFSAEIFTVLKDEWRQVRTTGWDGWDKRGTVRFILEHSV